MPKVITLVEVAGFSGFLLVLAYGSGPSHQGRESGARVEAVAAGPEVDLEGSAALAANSSREATFEPADAVLRVADEPPGESGAVPVPGIGEAEPFEDDRPDPLPANSPAGAEVEQAEFPVPSMAMPPAEIQTIGTAEPVVPVESGPDEPAEHAAARILAALFPSTSRPSTGREQDDHQLATPMDNAAVHGPDPVTESAPVAACAPVVAGEPAVAQHVEPEPSGDPQPAEVRAAHDKPEQPLGSGPPAVIAPAASVGAAAAVVDPRAVAANADTSAARAVLTPLPAHTSRPAVRLSAVRRERVPRHPGARVFATGAPQAGRPFPAIYEILYIVGGSPGVRAIPEVLVPELSPAVPLDEQARVVHMIAEREALERMIVYCTREARMARHSVQYAQDHPGALAEGLLGEYAQGRFTPHLQGPVPAVVSESEPRRSQVRFEEFSRRSSRPAAQSPQPVADRQSPAYRERARVLATPLPPRDPDPTTFESRKSRAPSPIALSGKQHEPAAAVEPDPAGAIDASEPSLPAYEVLRSTDAYRSERRYAEILIPGLSPQTPLKEQARIVRAIAQREGFDSMTLYRTPEAREANYSMDYADRHPMALHDGLIGEYERGKFSPHR